MQEKHRDAGFEVIGLNTDDEPGREDRRLRRNNEAELHDRVGGYRPSSGPFEPQQVSGNTAELSCRP
jgi:hypothetical protein